MLVAAEDLLHDSVKMSCDRNGLYLYFYIYFIVFYLYLYIAFVFFIFKYFIYSLCMLNMLF